jgi:CheY-like chemotaxis protein
MTEPAKKIIIFVDDEDILSICTYVLEELGWEVHSFTDCKDIISRVETVMPRLILMDNWIPDEGGIAATQRLKSEPGLRHIPVIYFSANSDIALLAQQAGADSYLAKPFDLDELQAVLCKQD